MASPAGAGEKRSSAPVWAEAARADRSVAAATAKTDRLMPARLRGQRSTLRAWKRGKPGSVGVVKLPADGVQGPPAQGAGQGRVVERREPLPCHRSPNSFPALPTWSPW